MSLKSITLLSLETGTREPSRCCSCVRTPWVHWCPACLSAFLQLEAMGFDRQLAIEAFFACDKDEQLAANYLLEHGMEFED